ncbi:MAG: chlororespiratory reduction protein 7 [Synechococcales bacterium]|nr:chlororespiratory reduction protein 7 [Synechococcales bacterium]
MVDPRLYDDQSFVVLATNQPEEIVTRDELLSRLQQILTHRQDHLPRDLQHLSEIDEQAEYLLDTSCELDMGAGEFLQWYAVRLEKE